MGITSIQGTVRGLAGKEAVVDFLVDSGATYSLLPEPVWRKLELEPKRHMSFRLADGAQLTRQVSECLFILAGEPGHAPVVLSQPGDDQALLGVVTLQNLGLVFNPFSRTLQPMRMLLVSYQLYVKVAAYVLSLHPFTPTACGENQNPSPFHGEGQSLPRA